MGGALNLCDIPERRNGKALISSPLLSSRFALGQAKGARRVTRSHPLKAEAPDYARIEREIEFAGTLNLLRFLLYAFLSYFRVDENFGHVPGGKEINHRYVQTRSLKILFTSFESFVRLIVEKTCRKIVNQVKHRRCCLCRLTGFIIIGGTRSSEFSRRI